MAVEYFKDDDYYWFSIQTIFFLNFALLLLWMLTSLILFITLSLLTLACSSDSKGAIKFMRKYLKEKFWVPFKYSIIYLWPLSPFLGLIYLYPLCCDMEYRKGISDKIKIRFSITILHEMIRSGGSLILQPYTLAGGKY